MKNHTVNARRASLIDAAHQDDIKDALSVRETEEELRLLHVSRSKRVLTCPVTKQEFISGDGKYVSAEGLTRLCEAGVMTFEAVTGHRLPHNLIRTAMSGSVGAVGPHGRRLSAEGADSEIGDHAQLGGWLNAAAGLWAVRRMITKTTSSRGINSPHTKIDLWGVVERFPSPHRLERKLWATRARARIILAAYSGEHDNPSWAGLMAGLMQTEHVGKAAVIAVATTLKGRGWGDTSTYRLAREWLTEFHRCSTEDTSDGVACRINPEPIYDRLGIAVYRAAMVEVGRSGQPAGLQFGTLVRSESGRTWHQEGCGGEIPYKNLVRYAIEAWRRQDLFLAKESDLVGFLQGGGGYCPVVYLGDSYQAGNCHPGTASWVRSKGWAGRRWIPGEWLIPHLGEARVRAVALACRREVERAFGQAG